MDIREAAKTAEAFLASYTLEKNHFRKTAGEKDFTLKLRLVQPRPGRCYSHRRRHHSHHGPFGRQRRPRLRGHRAAVS